MKRFIVLFLVCMLFGSGVCSAEVYQKKDEFTGGIINASNYKSMSKGNILDVLYLYQIKTNQKVDYKIKASVTIIKRFGLSNKVVQINVDGDSTSDLPILNMHDIPVDGEHWYLAEYQTPQDVIDRIKTANRVALKFTQNDGSQFVFVLPENVLSEWKEVIAMEK